MTNPAIVENTTEKVARARLATTTAEMGVASASNAQTAMCSEPGVWAREAALRNQQTWRRKPVRSGREEALRRKNERHNA